MAKDRSPVPSEPQARALLIGANDPDGIVAVSGVRTLEVMVAARWVENPNWGNLTATITADGRRAVDGMSL